MQLLFDNRNQHIGGHGTPDLRLHRILAGAQKTLDAQVLLDPLEEQFHLPAAGSMPFRVERNDLISPWPERTDEPADA